MLCLRFWTLMEQFWSFQLTLYLNLTITIKLKRKFVTGIPRFQTVTVVNQDVWTPRSSSLLASRCFAASVQDSQEWNASSSSSLTSSLVTARGESDTAGFMFLCKWILFSLLVCSGFISRLLVCCQLWPPLWVQYVSVLLSCSISN